MTSACVGAYLLLVRLSAAVAPSRSIHGLRFKLPFYLYYLKKLTDVMKLYFSYKQDSDVPQAVLPDPFNQSSVAIEEELFLEVLSSSSETKILDPSHFPPSFTKQFHEKVITMDMENNCLSSHTKSACVTNEVNSQAITPPDSSSNADKNESTPMKLPSGTEIILIQTPVQSTPMRSISPSTSSLTFEDDNKTTFSQNSKQPASSAKKSLDFCAVEGQGSTLSYKQESVSLSDLVPLIYQIFCSANFIPITKEELVHKITMFNCDVDDQSKLRHLLSYFVVPGFLFLSPLFFSVYLVWLFLSFSFCMLRRG